MMLCAQRAAHIIFAADLFRYEERAANFEGIVKAQAVLRGLQSEQIGGNNAW